jgi:hypothetical protein
VQRLYTIFSEEQSEKFRIFKAFFIKDTRSNSFIDNINFKIQNGQNILGGGGDFVVKSYKY